MALVLFGDIRLNAGRQACCRRLSMRRFGAQSEGRWSRADGCQEDGKTGSKASCRRRIQFLTTMSAQVIRDVKLAALEDGANAWEIMEEAAKNGWREGGPRRG